MRRRIPVVVIGLVTALAVVAGVWVVGVASQHRSVPAEDSPRIPADFTWAWVTNCIDVYDTSGLGVTSFTIADDGTATVGLGYPEEDGEFRDAPDRTEEANACIAARRIDPGTHPRIATQAERAAIYDWAVRWQRPCLAARGFDVHVAPRSDFLDPGSSPWFLLDAYAGNSFIPFDTLLEARLACPPLPPYLSATGVLWG